MYLAITDGTLTVVLSGTAPVRGCTYFPDTAEYRDGDWQRVVEDATVNLQGSESAIRATINNLNLLFTRAVNRQNGNGTAKVLVNYKPVDSDSTAYQSEIYNGRVVWSRDPGLRRLGDINPPAQVSVIWERAPGWDGALTELSLSAPSQGAATGGRVLYNNPATGNWVQAAAGQVGGDLPTPVKLVMTNTTGSSQNMEKLFINVNAYSDPANLTYVYQGEDRLSGGTPTSDGTASNSATVNFSTASPVSVSWSITQANMQRTAGRWARIVARLYALGQLYIRPSIVDSSGATTLWRGDEVNLGSLPYETLWDLGAVPLPPGGYDPLAGAARLNLEFRGGANVQFDFFTLAMIDSFRYLELSSVAVPNTAAIVHDGTEGLTYIDASGSHTPLATTFGEPLLLQPGALQRIHVLWERIQGTTGNVPMTGQLTVRAYVRPRRLTV